MAGVRSLTKASNDRFVERHAVCFIRYKNKEYRRIKISVNRRVFTVTGC